jgi:hypothetical protein
MSKATVTEEKNNYPEGLPEGLVDEMAEELLEEEEGEEAAAAAAEAAAEAAEEVGGADLVDTYLKSVGRYPMLKIEEEQEFVRMLGEGRTEGDCTQLSTRDPENPCSRPKYQGRACQGI